MTTWNWKAAARGVSAPKQGLGAAVAVLEIAKDVCDTNAPINARAGKAAQAKLERANSAEYATAIRTLKGNV